MQDPPPTYDYDKTREPGQPVGSPYPQYGQPYGQQQYGQPYGQQHGQPYGQQYGQPYGQSTNTTVVTTQPNVVVMQTPQVVPNSHMALAIVSCLLCFWPTGIVAIICSSQSSDLARAGDYEGAASKGRISLGFSIAGMVIGALAVIIVLVIYFTIGFGTYYYYGK